MVLLVKTAPRLLKHKIMKPILIRVHWDLALALNCTPSLKLLFKATRLYCSCINRHHNLSLTATITCYQSFSLGRSLSLSGHYLKSMLLHVSKPSQESPEEHKTKCEIYKHRITRNLLLIFKCAAKSGAFPDYVFLFKRIHNNLFYCPFPYSQNILDTQTSSFINIPLLNCIDGKISICFIDSLNPNRQNNVTNISHIFSRKIAM